MTKDEERAVLEIAKEFRLKWGGSLDSYIDFAAAILATKHSDAEPVILGFDPASPQGDYSCEVKGHIDSGVMVIDEATYNPPQLCPKCAELGSKSEMDYAIIAGNNALIAGLEDDMQSAEARCEQKASRILELDVAVHTERARAEATEAELAKVQTLIAEYISAYDNASDPQAVGSTCRLIRAESAMRDYLEDYK